MTNNKLFSTGFWGLRNHKGVATVAEITKDRVVGTVSWRGGMPVPFEAPHNGENFCINSNWFFFKNWSVNL